MPRVLSYTPSWLCRPSPGFDLFRAKTPSKLASTAQVAIEDAEPLQTIARRGTEIFVAVGNELRWSDLVLLKEDWEAKNSVDLDITGDELSDSERLYRILKVPVSRKIKRLVVSPQGDYVAIVTSHTVHVAVLPDPSLLNAQDSGPLRLRTYQLGPTTHVLERAALASVLWHPLGVDGCCLVTVTADAVVRLWELDTNNRWSFDSASLAVDLKRLAIARSSGEDFTPSKHGSSRVFSPDSFEWEVASACFGGNGEIGEDGWASSTLWVGMRQGDVYALCPLLPSSFQLQSSTTNSLVASIQAKADDTTTNTLRRVHKQQTVWIKELQTQLQAEARPTSTSDQLDVFTRPSHLSSTPRLQGPFQYAPDADQFFDITDIFVIGGGAVGNEDYDPELGAEDERAVLPLNVICIATSDGKVHLCLDTDGVEAAWLPSKRSSLSQGTDDDDLPELLVIESLTLDKSNDNSWPVFTADVLSRHSIFVTHSHGVHYVSISPWAERLAEEMDAAIDAGIEFRVELALDNARTILEQPIRLSNAPREAGSEGTSITACLNFDDGDLGYFVMILADGLPQTANLENDEYGQLMITDGAEDELEDHRALATSNETRPSYQAPSALWAESSMARFMDQHVHSRHMRSMKDEVRLSSNTFELMMDAHRILSQETHRLGLAAADLFSRCERMQDEFKDQLARVDDIANRIDSVLDDNADTYEDDDDDLLDTKENIEKRLREASALNESLLARHTELRRKLSRVHGTPLSKKEQTWVSEVDGFAKQVEGLAGDSADDVPLQQKRLQSVRTLTKDLAAQCQEQAEAAKESTEQAERSQASAERTRDARMQIDFMLERQSALVEALIGKINRLNGLSL